MVSGASSWRSEGQGPDPLPARRGHSGGGRLCRAVQAVRGRHARHQIGETMHVIAGVLGFALLVAILSDALQTIVVARRAQRLPRITQAFYQCTWWPLSGPARRIKSDARRESYLCLYGPLSLLVLLACWAFGLIVAFAMLQWSANLRFAEAPLSFAGDIVVSAGTFFTLGAGDPVTPFSRILIVVEAGFGFSFLGLVIGYLPVLYESYSDRELRISLLDARAGSPPSAAELLLRRGANPEKLEQRLAEWEEWAVGLLQTHLSYPMLAYYRSQHANQSWLGALTTIVDVSALVSLAAEGDLKRRAQFTFAAGRHALVHIVSVFRARCPDPSRDRLPADGFAQLCAALSHADTPILAERVPESELRELRTMYEPYAGGLSNYFLMALPPWVPGDHVHENWRVSSWDHMEVPNTGHEKSLR